MLEARFGPLTPMDTGMQSRVYAAPGGDVVVKVYRTQRGEHRLEAQNMRRADLGEWVVDTVEADGVEALILRRFPGHPLRAQDIPVALPPAARDFGRTPPRSRGPRGSAAGP